MSMNRLMRETQTAAGMVTRVVFISPSGQVEGADAYRSGSHIWRRAEDETPDAFEARVLEEAEWLALRRGEPVALIPLSAS